MTNQLGKPSIVLVNIDNDGSFVDPTGSLYVSGAERSANRAAAMIDRNREAIDLIISSNDTHHDDHEHIFYGIWWIDRNGKQREALTDIYYTDVRDGLWLPTFEKEWSVKYAQTLGHFTIWPHHCDENTPDSQIVPVLANAINRHATFHGIQNTIITKGLNRRVEMYGIFGSEVEDPEDPSTKTNVGLIKTIADYDRSYWFGQEGLHCVKRSMEQYIDWCTANKPEAITKMRYIIDCVDILDLGLAYTQTYNDFISWLVQKGVQLTKSTDPLS